MKYQSIQRCRDVYPVQLMCRCLRVSTSGFYGWAKRPPSEREVKNWRLLLRIRAHHEASDGVMPWPPGWGAKRALVGGEMRFSPRRRAAARSARDVERLGAGVAREPGAESRCPFVRLCRLVYLNGCSHPQGGTGPLTGASTPEGNPKAGRSQTVMRPRPDASRVRSGGSLRTERRPLETQMVGVHVVIGALMERGSR